MNDTINAEREHQERLALVARNAYFECASCGRVYVIPKRNTWQDDFHYWGLCCRCGRPNYVVKRTAIEASRPEATPPLAPAELRRRADELLRLLAEALETAIAHGDRIGWTCSALYEVVEPAAEFAEQRITRGKHFTIDLRPNDVPLGPGPLSPHDHVMEPADLLRPGQSVGR